MRLSPVALDRQLLSRTAVSRHNLVDILDHIILIVTYIKMVTSNYTQADKAQ